MRLPDRVYVNTIGLHFVLFVVGLPQFGGQTFSFGGIAPLPLAGCGPGMRCEMMTFNEMQQVGSVKEKQDRSEDRALWHSALQKEVPMAPNWMSSCELAASCC